MLPLFALANAGLSSARSVFDARSVAAAIAVGLIIGKRVGFVLASAPGSDGLRAPRDFHMWQVLARTLAGNVFTISLFIAGRSSRRGDFAAAKAAIFAASAVSGRHRCVLRGTWASGAH